MQRHIAHYTLVRLLPQADAGELANIGVVLACPTLGFFDYRLIKRYARVTRFFEEFGEGLFIKVRREVDAELRHIRAHLGTDDRRRDAMVLQVMQDLAKPRETIIRYAPLRAVMSEDPAAELDRLFRRYVQRDPDELRQHREGLLNRAVRRVLHRERLDGAFVPDEVGTDDFHVKLPLVHLRNGSVVAAIKPMDLTQDEPVKIYEHGGQWAERFRRLRRMRQLPQAGVLVAADGPGPADERRHRAFSDIVEELREADVEVTTAGDAQRIVAFARANAN